MPPAADALPWSVDGPLSVDSPLSVDVPLSVDSPPSADVPDPVVLTVEAGECDECGTSRDSNDRYCGECGNPLPGDTSIIELLSAELRSSSSPSSPALSPAALSPAALSPATPTDFGSHSEGVTSESAEGVHFVLQFSTGESYTVVGSGLVGRNPRAEPGEYLDHLVAIVDPGRSVSKTHVEFGHDSGVFWVSDRHSGNGTVIRQPGVEPRLCEPGRRYPVVRGTRIDIGEQFVVVS